jgi:hypothetical protein
MDALVMDTDDVSLAALTQALEPATESSVLALKDWDAEFFRLAFAYTLDELTCAGCGARGSLRGDGKSNNSYRVRCSQCSRSFSGFEEDYASFFEYWIEYLKGDLQDEQDRAFFKSYKDLRPVRPAPGPKPGSSRMAKLQASAPPLVLPDQNSLALLSFEQVGAELFANMVAWNVLPGIRISDATVQNLMSMLKFVATQQDPVLQQDQLVKFKALIASMDADFRAMSSRFAAAPMDTAVRHTAHTVEMSPRSARVSPPLSSSARHQGTPLSPTFASVTASGSVRNSGPRSSLPAASGSASSGSAWTTIGKNGRPLPESSSPRVALRPAKWRSVEVTKDMEDRFWTESKRCHRNELVFLYSQGFARDRFWKIRALLEAKDLPQHWFRELAFHRDGTLEMLVHAERASEIIDRLTALRKPTASALADLGIEVTDTVLKDTQARYRRRLASLPAKAVGVRYYLRRSLEALDADDLDVDVEASMSA